MKRILLGLLALVVLAIVGLVVGRNLIARKAVEIGAAKATGFPITIGSMDVHPMDSKITARNIRLLNPDNYEDKIFADLPELVIDYRLMPTLRGDIHINEMFVDIDSLVIIKTKPGESNASQLKNKIMSGEKKTKYQLDKLRCHVGTVVVKDYSRAKPTERTYKVNINATYNNITDSTDITRLVLLTIVNQVVIPDIGIKVDELKKGLLNATTSTGQAISNSFSSAAKSTKGFFERFKKTQAAETNAPPR